MVHDFRFGLSIFTTHLTWIENDNTGLAVCSGNSRYVIFHVEKKFKAYVYQMCSIYAKTKSEIIKKSVYFFHFKL